MQWKIGSGTRIKFWEDKWLDDMPLMPSYPRLYANSNNKHVTLWEVGQWRENKWEWHLTWRRQWFQREKPQVFTFMSHISRTTLNLERGDTWCREMKRKKYTRLKMPIRS